ncbi:DUF6303 family protein [Streptomyces sp. AJS327]|uniref:DUF6303 family protein n=1 Tax=Streptomyces sp. AJS327 TaxID=2545265 RepID=UPI0027E53A08|nr:DUF6303 family protein [Streptomyces sp. AJS327]
MTGLPGSAPPSVQECSRALDVLGYAVVPGVEGEWTESSESPDDPASPVCLIASVRVREATR